MVQGISTLDQGIFREVNRAAGFRPNNHTHLIRMPVNRLDILINMQVIGKDHSKYKVLKQKNTIGIQKAW